MEYRISTLCSVLSSVISVTLLAGCNSSNSDKPIPIIKDTTNIQWTSYGVPHISAENYIDLGEGLGYVMAQNRLCNILEGIVTAKSKRAELMGSGIENSNIDSDFAYLHLGTYQRAETGFSDLSEPVQDLMKGYAKGFNHWLNSNQGSDQTCSIPEQNISHIDLYALNLSISYWGFIGNFIQQIGQASLDNLSPINNQNVADKMQKETKGSNGWAIGKSLSASGKGLLLSNTHLDHGGRFQWYEAHLTIPDEINVYGGFLPGFITPALGFNESFAWTHTWSSSQPGTLYYLTSPDNSDLGQYLYGGQSRSLQSAEHHIRVKQSDGSSLDISRVLHNSHYGPVVGLDEAGRIVVAKDAPSIDANIGEYWIKLAKSKDVEEAVALNEQGFRTGSQNILMVDNKGEAFYGDMSSVPGLSHMAWQEINSNIEQYISDSFGLLLDGSKAVFDWQEVVSFENIPKRYSQEYVQNANESAWLVNVSQPILDFSILYGETHYEQSPRTRLSLAMLESFKAGSKKVSIQDLQSAMADKSIYLAQHTKTDLVQRCIDFPQVSVDGQIVDLSEACQILQNWDMKAELNSVGSIIFREYAFYLFPFKYVYGCEVSCWQTPFNAVDPVKTPSGLPPIQDPDTDWHLRSLASAVLVLEQAGIPLNAKLETVQKLTKGDSSIPIAGGFGDVTGSFSTVTGSDSSSYSQSGLDESGYGINSGDGFIFLAEFSQQGVNAKSVLLYSQSNSPESPHYFDQAELIEGAQYKDIRFTPREIKEDPNLRIEILTIQ